MKYHIYMQCQQTWISAAGRSWFKRCAPWCAMAAVVALSGALVACVPIRSRPDVIGIYELNSAHEKITLAVSPDETFTETILFASGEVEKRVGRWRWSYGGISFDQLWIPKSFAPDYILQADSEAGPGRTKYTEPGHWSITAENHWGTTILPIFPDANIHFKMVKRL